MDVQQIAKKYVDRWNKNPNNSPLWVVLANPGDAIPIPGVTFGKIGEARAGMELPINAHLIVLNPVMSTESQLTTFLHEYGHTIYRKQNPRNGMR